MPHVRELKLPPGVVLESPAHGEWYWDAVGVPGLRAGPFKTQAAAWTSAWRALGKRWPGSPKTLARMGANRGRAQGGRHTDAEYERAGAQLLLKKYPELRAGGRSRRGVRATLQLLRLVGRGRR